MVGYGGGAAFKRLDRRGGHAGHRRRPGTCRDSARDGVEVKAAWINGGRGVERGDLIGELHCGGSKTGHTIEPVDAVVQDGKAIVTARLTGNFPGSPVKLEFVFELEGDRIKALDIH